MISFLIKCGANIDTQDICGRTPLHIAVENNYVECVKVLLYELADPFKKNKMNEMAIDICQDRTINYYLSYARAVF